MLGRKRLPGQTNIFALLLSGAWMTLGLFILIIGHLAIVFWAYGIATESDALAELETFLPALKAMHLYILAGLAIIADIWIVVSSRNERKSMMNRQR